MMTRLTEEQINQAVIAINQAIGDKKGVKAVEEQLYELAKAAESRVAILSAVFASNAFKTWVRENHQDASEAGVSGSGVAGAGVSEVEVSGAGAAGAGVSEVEVSEADFSFNECGIPLINRAPASASEMCSQLVLVYAKNIALSEDNLLVNQVALINHMKQALQEKNYVPNEIIKMALWRSSLVTGVATEVTIMTALPFALVPLAASPMTYKVCKNRLLHTMQVVKPEEYQRECKAAAERLHSLLFTKTAFTSIENQITGARIPAIYWGKLLGLAVSMRTNSSKPGRVVLGRYGESFKLFKAVLLSAVAESESAGFKLACLEDMFNENNFAYELMYLKTGNTDPKCDNRPTGSRIKMVKELAKARYDCIEGFLSQHTLDSTIIRALRVYQRDVFVEQVQQSVDLYESKVHKKILSEDIQVARNNQTNPEQAIADLKVAVVAVHRAMKGFLESRTVTGMHVGRSNQVRFVDDLKDALAVVTSIAVSSEMQNVV